MERPRSRFTPSLPAGRASRRSWLLGWWSLWRVPTLVTIVAALWWFGVRPIASEQGWVRVEAAFSLCGEAPRTEACVIDGDTVLITRAGARARRVRLTGFATPEQDGPWRVKRALRCSTGSNAARLSGTARTPPLTTAMAESCAAFAAWPPTEPANRSPRR